MGIGCNPGCCNWNLNLFFKNSGLQPSDILLANYDVDLHRRVYIVCVDHKMKAMIVIIRGTLSLADTLVDLDARPISMEGHGYVECIVHGRTEGRMDERKDGWMNGRTDGLMDAWMERWTDRWMDV
jgi:hypothetical protein